MSFGIKLHVWGEYACFTRPEMKVERVSYDVMTPSAARGILEAIHWKPAIRWTIDRIHVLKPIRFENLRRNELGHKISAANVRKAMRSGETRALRSVIEEDRQQRATTLGWMLHDVDYANRMTPRFFPRCPEGRSGRSAIFRLSRGEGLTILGALSDHYDRLVANGRAPSYGYSHESTSFCVVLSPTGEVVDVGDLRDLSGESPKPSRRAVPRPVNRSVNIAPNFLWDKTAYALGMTRRSIDEGAVPTKPWRTRCV